MPEWPEMVIDMTPLNFRWDAFQALFRRDVSLPESLRGWTVRFGGQEPPDDDDASVTVDRASETLTIRLSDRVLSLDVDRGRPCHLSAQAMGAGVDAVRAALKRQGF